MATLRGIFGSSISGAGLLLLMAALAPCGAFAQAPAATNGPKIGTVKAISGSSVTLATDAGQPVAVNVAAGAHVLQLAPGSKDLKSAQTITLGDIAVGDRIMVSGKAGDNADSFTASRVILMKAQDIAQKHVAEQTDWQTRGTGGLVSAVDQATGTLNISIGAKKVEVHTSPATKFRRYAGASVKFEDAQPGTLAQVRPGDQVRVLGTKSESDGGQSIQAEVVVSGSFLHLAGTIASIDAANGTLTLKDLATKRMMTVKLTSDSDLRNLPPQAATGFAARAHGAASAHGGQGSAHPVAQANVSAPQNDKQQEQAAGMDLSQMLSKLPTETISDLKVGDAVMIVASQQNPGSPDVSAVTLLSGVGPILAATPKGGAAMNLSPWQVGGGAPEGGGAQQ